jgi:L-asparaginase II
MSNPILVEVTRGALVESRHRGAVAVADADGRMVWQAGDTERPVFPRSAVKALQALVLVESGAADRYRFTEEELALACASHSGEPGHVAAVEGVLHRAGLDASALRCGAHWPMSQSAAQALARTGVATALHNNCSGKHAGFLCAACAMGVPHDDYVTPQHPVQREVCAAIGDLAGVNLSPGACAIDGCSVPTWAAPLQNLAHAFARLGTGVGLAPQRVKAVARLRSACMRHPWYVAGTGRFCTEVMQSFGERVFVKTGAEGVYCGALPDQGLGIAIKCDDGAGRAAEVVMAAMIARFLGAETSDHTVLKRLMRPILRNWNGIEVGRLQPTDVLTAAAV